MMNNYGSSETAARGCLWWEQGQRPPARRALDGDRTADVVIVGAGYTGLWTAYYLAVADPTLEIAVAEADVIGSGASGRNGGFCSSVLPIGLRTLARRHGREAAIGLQRAAVRTIDEIESVLRAEDINCGWRRGGMRWVATDPTQHERLVSLVEGYRRFGFDASHVDLEATSDRGPKLSAVGMVGSAYSPHSAAINPAQLAWGLANAAERRGVTIFEHTRVVDVGPGLATTERGTPSAPVIVRATEGYSVALPGLRRRILPVYSHMIATEPLQPEVWSQIGWDDGTTVSDMAREFFYAQRTPDDRIAIGGRGITYHWRSGFDPAHEEAPAVTQRLQTTLTSLWPDLSDAVVTHRWGGVLGVPRTWEPFVTHDPSTGMWAAGGYTGDGVLFSNLVGRMLAAGIAEHENVGGTAAIRHRRPRGWEPEPLRGVAVRLIDSLALYLDQRARQGRPNRIMGRLCDWVVDK